MAKYGKKSQAKLEAMHEMHKGKLKVVSLGKKLQTQSKQLR